MHVVFFMTNTPLGYSGGRYHAVLMAEALSATGHEVTICTNNKPVFFDEFEQLPAHDSIRILLSSSIAAKPEGNVDVVVVVPHGGPAPWLYDRALCFARECEARVVLLNFESPNWFNTYSPEPRDPDLWEGWVQVSRHADMILSSAAESTKYAKEFYVETPEHTLFRHCGPPINSIVADSVQQPPKQKQILCITRMGTRNAHKGGGELLKALCPALKGYTLLLMIGSGNVDDALMEELTQRANKFGAEVEVACSLTDREKFNRIKQSSMMLFLSHFEGFGYPPVEAEYCDVPCIVYDLPVLREVSGEGLIYVPPGDGEALREAITAVVEGHPDCADNLSERIAPQVSFSSRMAELDELIKEVSDLDTPAAAPSATDETAQRWKRSILKWRILRPFVLGRRQAARAKNFLRRLARRAALKVMVILARPVRRVSPEFVNLVKLRVLGE